MGKYYLGVDIGSLTVKTVLVEKKGQMLGARVERTGFHGKEVANRLISQLCREAAINPGDIAGTVATGYGRLSFPAEKEVSEISCQARGIAHLFPSAGTVVDIGGQDSKVIKVLPGGKVADFNMNDKCAAGTGRFLEVMAQALEVEVGIMGDLALKAVNRCTISSTCTVFAESEVISHIAGGAPKEDIAAGICKSVADRVKALGDRLTPEPEIVLTGGVALNSGVVSSLQEALGVEISVPEEPQVTAALGAALIATFLDN